MIFIVVCWLFNDKIDDTKITASEVYAIGWQTDQNQRQFCQFIMEQFHTEISRFNSQYCREHLKFFLLAFILSKKIISLHKLIQLTDIHNIEVNIRHSLFTNFHFIKKKIISLHSLYPCFPLNFSKCFKAIIANKSFSTIVYYNGSR